MRADPTPTFEYPEATYTIGGETVRIVCTPETLGGKPRIENSRVCVHYIHAKYEKGRSLEELYDSVYSQLSPAALVAAVRYAQGHPEVLEDVARIESLEWEALTNSG